MPLRERALALWGANRRFLESLYSREQLGEGMVELLRVSEEPGLRLAGGQSLAPTRALQLAAEGERASAPEWIQLIPPGVGPERHVDTRDWRAGFRVLDPHAVVRRFNEQPAAQRRKVIDRNHIEHRNWDARETPAAGWLLELAVRNTSEIWGRVEWTSEGRDDVETKRYGYISPVVSLLYPTNSETGERDYSKVPELYEIKDASLVNSPALYIRWLLGDREGDDEQSAIAASPQRTKDTRMSNHGLEQFLQHFGLAPDAPPEAFERAARQLAAQSQPPPESPRVGELEAKLAALEAEQRRNREAATAAQVRELCSAAQRDGKFIPAHQDSWVLHGLRVGPEALATELAALPRLALTMPAKLPALPSTEELGALDEGDSAMAEYFGLTPEEFSQAKGRQRGVRLGEQRRAAARAVLGDTH